MALTFDKLGVAGRTLAQPELSRFSTIRACGVNVPTMEVDDKLYVRIRANDGLPDFFNAEELREIADRLEQHQEFQLKIGTNLTAQV